MSELIERHAAIDAINSWRGRFSEEYNEAIDDCENSIKELQTIQPKPQWIPCSERMPEDLSEVNVTWVNHNPEPYYEFTKDKPFTATAVYYKGEWYWLSATCVDYLAEYGRCDWNKVDKAIEIVAWMPLPEPYKPNNK